MKKFICLFLVLVLVLTACSVPAEIGEPSTENKRSTEQFQSRCETENILSDEEALETVSVLIEKYLRFSLYMMEMAEFGPYNIDDLETFEEDGVLYAEYIFTNFSEYESALAPGRNWDEEIFSFSSIEEINNEILSIFVTLEASRYSGVVNHIFKEHDQKLFYNTNEESMTFGYFWDYQNPEIAEKSETKISFSVYSELLDKTGAFSIIKNSGGEWRLSEDIRNI
ncbi:MAG: hypothetical protein ACI4IT_05360 [Oscillospiraceae bacterium]